MKLGMVFCYDTHAVTIDKPPDKITTEVDITDRNVRRMLLKIMQSCLRDDTAFFQNSVISNQSCEIFNNDLTIAVR